MDRPDPERAILEEAARLLVSNAPVVALTGAGISAECGIPPFRGAGGLWDRYPPDEFATVEAFRNDPAKVWRMLAEILSTSREARPGLGHLALARLEEQGVLAGVITQNVDGLHQLAGSASVAELHGNGRELLCAACGNRCDGATAQLEALPPRCELCRGPLRPDVVLFGEQLPIEAVSSADRWIDSAGALLVVGTSCEVYPAAAYPELALLRGVPVIELNPDETPLSGRATICLRGRAGDILPVLADRIVQQKK